MSDWSNLVKSMSNMYISQHSEFILTPLIKILIDGISACHAIGDGMDSYPMGEYLMQSLFLKMTGAQEQKMKCICWDLATTDYEYRYEFLNKKSYGECSDYKSKNGIYNDLIAAIEHKDSSFSISTLIDAVLLNRTISKINEVFSKSSLSIWQNREYVFYQLHKVNIFSSTQIGKPKQNGAKAYSLFQAALKDWFEELVYKHRNRCAHNTLSYQVNKPDLNTLADAEYEYHSYFFRFSILVLMDEIFMVLFRKYLELQNNRF